MSETRIAGIPVEAVLKIHQLVSEFAYRVDMLGGHSVEQLFAEDGYYEADGQRSTGRAAILRAYELRSARGPRTSRHLFTNLRLVWGGKSTYRATTIMLLFARDGDGVHTAEPLLVADVSDEYRVTDDGELEIQSRRLTTVFADPEHKPILPLGHELRDGYAL